MFPLRDDGPQLSPPLITTALVLANVGVWLITLFLSRYQEMYLNLTMGLVPAWLWGPHPADLPFSPWFGLIGYQFLHGGLWHLAGNMLYLWIFGSSLEDGLGHWRFAVFYLLGGVLAGLVQAVSDPSSQAPIIGASGSVAMVLGGYLVLYPRRRIVILLWLIFIVQTIRVPAVLALGVWFILQVLGADKGVAWMAHIGGFVLGIVLVRYFLPRRRPPGPRVVDASPTIH